MDDDTCEQGALQLLAVKAARERHAFQKRVYANAYHDAQKTHRLMLFSARLVQLLVMTVMPVFHSFGQKIEQQLYKETQ